MGAVQMSPERKIGRKALNVLIILGLLGTISLACGGEGDVEGYVEEDPVEFVEPKEDLSLAEQMGVELEEKYGIEVGLSVSAEAGDGYLEAIQRKIDEINLGADDEERFVLHPRGYHVIRVNRNGETMVVDREVLDVPYGILPEVLGVSSGDTLHVVSEDHADSFLEQEESKTGTRPLDAKYVGGGLVLSGGSLGSGVDGIQCFSDRAILNLKPGIVGSDSLTALQENLIKELGIGPAGQGQVDGADSCEIMFGLATE